MYPLTLKGYFLVLFVICYPILAYIYITKILSWELSTILMEKSYDKVCENILLDLKSRESLFPKYNWELFKTLNTLEKMNKLYIK